MLPTTPAKMPTPVPTAMPAVGTTRRHQPTPRNPQKAWAFTGSPPPLPAATGVVGVDILMIFWIRCRCRAWRRFDPCRDRGETRELRCARSLLPYPLASGLSAKAAGPRFLSCARPGHGSSRVAAVRVEGNDAAARRPARGVPQAGFASGRSPLICTAADNGHLRAIEQRGCPIVLGVRDAGAARVRPRRRQPPARSFAHVEPDARAPAVGRACHVPPASDRRSACAKPPPTRGAPHGRVPAACRSRCRAASPRSARRVPSPRLRGGARPAGAPIRTPRR